MAARATPHAMLLPVWGARRGAIIDDLLELSSHAPHSCTKVGKLLQGAEGAHVGGCNEDSDERDSAISAVLALAMLGPRQRAPTNSSPVVMQRTSGMALAGSGGPLDAFVPSPAAMRLLAAEGSYRRASSGGQSSWYGASPGQAAPQQQLQAAGFMGRRGSLTGDRTRIKPPESAGNSDGPIGKVSTEGDTILPAKLLTGNQSASPTSLTLLYSTSRLRSSLNGLPPEAPRPSGSARFTPSSGAPGPPSRQPDPAAGSADTKPLGGAHRMSADGRLGEAAAECRRSAFGCGPRSSLLKRDVLGSKETVGGPGLDQAESRHGGTVLPLINR
jgi:hypothetical protein